MAPTSPNVERSGIFPTLRDAEQQARFEQDGIVVLPFISADQARELAAVVHEVLPEDPGPFFDLFRNNPPALRKEVDALIRGALEARAAEVFYDHDFWSATVLVKPPGPAGEVGLHTDWNMVDETRYRSGLIWVALDDVTTENGGLYVVPGTNRLDVPYRGHNVHFDFDDPEVQQLIDARSVAVDVPIGHAAIWDNRLLHGSGPNTSGEWRIAAALGFKPREAALYHYRHDASGIPHRYQIDRRFFLDYQPFDPEEHPAGPFVLGAETLDEQAWALEAEELAALDPDAPRPPAPAPVATPELAEPVLAPPEPAPVASAAPATPQSPAPGSAPTPEPATVAPAPATGRLARLLRRGRRTAGAAAPTTPTAPMATPSPVADRPAPAATTEPRVAELRWLDLQVDEVADHPTLLADIHARRVDGITVAGVFTPEECAAAVASLEAHPEQRHPAMFGTMLGMSLANLAAHTGDARQRGPYFDDADAVRARYRDAFGADPFDRVAAVLAPAAGDRVLTAAHEDGRQYLAGNVRWMDPGGRALPAHVGNEFQQQRDGSTDFLRTLADLHDHYSWFVVLQPPEEGGALSVFDLLYESYEPAEATWGESGRDDAEFDRQPARRVAPEAGQLVIFGGGWRWHRVDRIGGTRPRITFGGFAGPSRDGTEINSWF